MFNLYIKLYVFQVNFLFFLYSTVSTLNLLISIIIILIFIPKFTECDALIYEILNCIQTHMYIYSIYPHMHDMCSRIIFEHMHGLYGYKFY